jgi:hypothetical protein
VSACVQTRENSLKKSASMLETSDFIIDDTGCYGLLADGGG